MTLRLDRRKVNARGASSLVAFAALMIPWPRLASHELAPRPPSSLGPKATTQEVLISHLHRRVRGCTAIPAKNPTACAAQSNDASAGTTLFLEPIAAPDGAPSRSQRIVVTFPETNGLQKQTVELPLGEWMIEWPGCRETGRLAISAARSVAPRFTLRTTSGGCELYSSQCRLLDGVVEQRLKIEE
jgi:hypothetical protein